jgi:gamma-glutamyltranspeptidase/glutathione hydrolase
VRKFFLVLILILISSSISAETETPVAAKKGMVVSEHYLASQVGIAILKAGGNAVDAAVAVGYALAVVDPCCGNIGGGGFMTLHLADGRNIFINFRERAPLAASKTMFQDVNGNVIPEKSTFGYNAVGTPGSVMGFDTALKRFGTMSRQQVIAPAIKLAENGFTLQAGDIKLMSYHLADFKKSPNVAAIFLKNGQPYQVGDKFVQKDLAQTLKLISEKGTDVFYKGQIAKEIVDASQAYGGILSRQDFTEYTAEELTPIKCTYRGYTIISAPPPSSGGVTLCEILNILEGFPLPALKYHTAESAHYTIEAMRYAFADRNSQLGDPDFVNNPVAKLISKDYAATIQKKILKDRATPSSELNPKISVHEGVNTTHYSIIDKHGNAVSVTVTLNSFFGSQMIAGDTGFFLNDEMDDLSAKTGSPNIYGLIEGDNNSIAPGKRPLSSMTPTIVMKDNKTIMIVGSPGGPRIITATLETMLNVLDYGMNIKQAVDAPRFHQQWLPDSVDIEPDAFSDQVMQKLKGMGYTFVSPPLWGAVQAIYINPKTKILYGASDKRRTNGKAIGY